MKRKTTKKTIHKGKGCELYMILKTTKSSFRKGFEVEPIMVCHTEEFAWHIIDTLLFPKFRKQKALRGFGVMPIPMFVD